VKILAPLTLAVVIIAGYNGFLARRDTELLNRYQTCSAYFDCITDENE